MTENEILELETQTEEYASLFSGANYKRKNFMLFTRSILKPGVDLQAVITSFDLAFDLHNAAGDQLDIIGSLVGVDRILKRTPANGNRTMDDTEFRMMIQMKVARNTWDGSNASAKSIYKSIFGESITIDQIDNQNMSVSVVAQGDISTRQAEILAYTDNLLIPCGVSFTFSVNNVVVELDMETGIMVSGTLRMDGVNVE